MSGEMDGSGVELKERLINVSRDGRDVPLYIVGPNNTKKCPGLIVVHEIFGLNEHIRRVARRFAGQSLRVFAPDLFAGWPDLPEDRNNLDAMRKTWASIPDSLLIADLKSVLAAATSSDEVITDKIGIIGYCMGGAIAFMFACSASEIAFVIDYYGRVKYPQLSENKPKHPVDYAEGLKCPVLGIFSGIDDLIPAADRDLFTSTIERLGQSVEIKVYEDAPHAFFNDEREHYRPDAAADAWTLTLQFIEKLTNVAS